MRHAGGWIVWALLLTGLARAESVVGRYAIQGRDAAGRFRGQGALEDAPEGYRVRARYTGGRADLDAQAGDLGSALVLRPSPSAGMTAVLSGAAASQEPLELQLSRASGGALEGRWRAASGALVRVERWTPVSSAQAAPASVPGFQGGGPLGEPGPAVSLSLGEARRLEAGAVASVAVPLPGGRLHLHGEGSPDATVVGPDGVTLAGDLREGFAVRQAGRHRVHAGRDGVVGVRYLIEAATAPAETPYNFWYFPFFDDLRPNGGNLYEAGGVFAKLDRVFGLTPEGAPFDGLRHLDARPGRPFVPAADELALYDPSTTRGFAWSYQRTLDPDRAWMGHCGGATIAASLYLPPRGRTITLADGARVDFSTEEVEGVLAAYFESQQVQTEVYFQGCPAGPPTLGTGSQPNLDFTNRYADDLWRGLTEGIARDGVPLVADLRSVSGEAAQNWNHVVFAFWAELTAVAGDPELVEVEVTVVATSDVFPSPETAPRREETYRFRIGCRDGQVVRDHPGQDFLEATHFAPRYLYRVQGLHGDGDAGCKNEPLGRRIGLARLEQVFGLERR